MTSEKQKPHGWNRGASKKQNSLSVTRPNQGPFRASSKPKLARAYLRQVDLPEPYKGPFLGWWGCLS